MTETIVAQIVELRGMTVGELREKYHEYYGDETRSGNRDWLWKRIAWRIQELEYGGLSERAKQRAGELANEADIRVRVPKEAFETVPCGGAKNGSGRNGSATANDRRLPVPGTVLTREYKGRTYHVQVRESSFEYDGRFFRSLSAVAREITGTHWNGFLFFKPALKGRR